MIGYSLRGVPVTASRKLRLRSIAQQATLQRHTLVHETPPAEEKDRTRAHRDIRIAR